MEDLPELTGHQLEIMKIVWQQPDVTVIEVFEKVNKQRKVARNTIQTMLTRLAEKGWLKVRKVGNTFRYTATQTRKTTAKTILSRISELVFDGSSEALIASLVDGEKLSSADADRLRSVIDTAEKEAKSQRKGKRKKKPESK